MAKYRLSSAADQDFEQLFEYGIDNFGLTQAKLYVDGLIIQFQSIADSTRALSASIESSNWEDACSAIREEWRVRRTLADGISTAEMDECF